MEILRPWWRGLEREVRDALALWAPDVDPRLEALEAQLRARVPGAEITRPEGADLCVAWDGVAGRAEVRLLLESDLLREPDLPRVLLRVLLQRGEDRTVLVALHGACAPDLVRALEVSLEGEDPVLEGMAQVMDLRDYSSGSSSPARAANG